MAYIVGFGGGREEGLWLIEKAAATPSEVQADARVALVLIYNREKRYDDAVNMLHGLERSYPQNRLFLLEEASTLLRGNKPAEANKVLEDAMGRLAEDRRPRMPGEDGRWHLKRGAARLRLGKLNEAEQDLRAATTAPDVRGWVQARIHIELGKLADVRGDRAAAQREYRAAIAVSKTAYKQ
jgi:tetratricopeptide (TPR) repeat protein